MINAQRLKELNQGLCETRNLSEALAVDFPTLLAASYPAVKKAYQKELGGGLGIVKRMELVGRLIAEDGGIDAYHSLIKHPSDTVRSWAAYALGALPKLTIKKRLKEIRPLADDSHFAVREWAWIAIRNDMAAELDESISLLEPWVQESSPYIRRYASEATRPRGVWCSHIQILKEEPERALSLLEPLKSDSEKYVQDSVANWLNDASKSQPKWVVTLCARWEQESPTPQTARIVKRALRTLTKQKASVK